MHVAASFTLRIFCELYSFSRGTKRFTIRVSPDNINWELVWDGEFTAHPSTLDRCSHPVLKLPVGNRNERFVEFAAVTHYGYSAGLQLLATEEGEYV